MLQSTEKAKVCAKAVERSLSLCPQVSTDTQKDQLRRKTLLSQPLKLPMILFSFRLFFNSAIMFYCF